MLSRGAWEDFRKTTLWESIKEELEVRIKQRMQELEDPDLQLTLDSIRQIQGGIKAYREISENLLDSLCALSEERT
jgi:hypothetical protein